jgi:hypothetical protein
LTGTGLVKAMNNAYVGQIDLVDELCFCATAPLAIFLVNFERLRRLALGQAAHFYADLKGNRHDHRNSKVL